MPTKKRRPRSGGPQAGLSVPASLRREAAGLLDQQLWCWGLDIRRPEGNALIAFGFERVPVAGGIRGSNAYVATVGEGITLGLWGSGLVFAKGPIGAVAISRFAFGASFSRSHELTTAMRSAGAVPELGPIVDQDANDRANVLIRSAIDAIIAYEEWAMGALGLAYRTRCVASWQKRQTPADQIVGAWRSIGERWNANQSTRPILQGMTR